jgi:hypothetical protein
MSMQQAIVLDTLGKLDAYGFRLFGCCHDCGSKYDRRRRENPPTHFDIDVAALAAERGADCAVVGLAPVVCPRADREARRRGCCLRDTGPGNDRSARGDHPRAL